MDGTNLEIEIYKKQTCKITNKQEKKIIIKYVNAFNKECLRLENYDFKLLFQKVRPKMLLQMFVSLLHERKIIIIHNESNKNAILIEALISLLYPLQWNFTNISYMIPSMVEYLEAPFPYIIGVPRDLWKHIYEQKWDILGEDVVAFDIDNQRVYEKEELPEFPQPYTQLLIKQLEIQLEKSKQIQVNNNVMDEEEKMREEDKFWNNFTLKVKQQFLNFLIFLINTFENFYVSKNPLLEDNKDSTTASATTLANQKTNISTLDSGLNMESKPVTVNNFNQGGSANDIFNFDEYVQNVRENKGFFEKFVRTQAFINFIEQAYYEEQGNINDASIRFFKECTRKLSKENIQSVRAMQDNLIQSLMHKYNDRCISYSIDKCYQLYEKALRINTSLLDFEDLIPTNKIKQAASKPMKQGQGLYSKFDHHKIVKMTAFDPTPHIQHQYMKGNESLHSMTKLNKINSKKGILKINLNNSIENEQLQAMKNNAASMNDYFSAQVTPQANMFQTQANEVQQQMNMTQQHIKVEDDYLKRSPSQLIEEECSNSSDIENEYEVNDKEPGLLGFFKNTFSSMKKTLFASNNIKKDAKRSKTPYDDSPDLSKAKSRTNANRQGRSQTFHLSSYQQVKRERKNNESFFVNLMNLATTKKDASIDQKTNVKGNLNQTTDLRQNRKINGSGFFVFNEEDMKNMTEMSPKNKTINARSVSLHFEHQALEGQLSQRQKPTIKSPPILESSNQNNLASRIRSISYQNQRQNTNNMPELVPLSKLKLMDMINESASSIALDDNMMVECGESPNLLTFANSNLQKDFVSSPLSHHKKIQQQKTPQQAMSSRITPKCGRIQANYGTAKKDVITIKKEFEEMYKKSTENLFCAPPNKNQGNGGKDKYNMWKSQTGKLDIQAQKPPIYNGNTSKKQSKNLANINNIQPKCLAMLSPKSARDHANQQLNNSKNAASRAMTQEEMKLSSSDNNYTDDEMKAPILGKNLSTFQKIMQGDAFERQSANSFVTTNKNDITQVIDNTKYHNLKQKHKRQVSSGQNMPILGDSNIINTSPHENIDPEEFDNRLGQTIGKQIESMQIGRVRKKSSSKVSMFSTAGNTKQNSRQTPTYGNRKGSINKLSSFHNKPKNENIKHNATQGQKSQVMKASNSSSSYQSATQNVELNPHSLNTSFGVERKKDISKYIMKKQQQLVSTSTLKNEKHHPKSDTQMIKNHSKTKIDLRDIKKGEVVKLLPQGPLSPQHQPFQGNRIHSLSQYADQNLHPNQVLSFDMRQMDSARYNNSSTNKMSEFRNNLKPMNKITFEAFSQIAKLSGDIDHEPNTPKSCGNITDDEYDESNI